MLLQIIEALIAGILAVVLVASVFFLGMLVHSLRQARKTRERLKEAKDEIARWKR